MDRWNALSKDDKTYVYIGGGCLAVGTLMAVASKNAWWFALGAASGAGVIGYRIVSKKKNDGEVNVQDRPTPPAPASTFSRSRSGFVHPDTGNDSSVGAPFNPPVDTGAPRGTGDLMKRPGYGEYPLMHRVPESQFWTDETDDRIRWQSFGPQGPYVGDRGIYGFQ